MKKITNIVMPAKAGISFLFKIIPASAGMTLILLFSFPALAAPFTYAPDTCDFQATFPEKPFIEQKCEKPDSCQEIVSYTQTMDASAMHFRIVCKKGDPVAIAAVTPDDLKSTLTDMVKDAGLNLFTQDSAVVEHDIKTSMALATGRRNGRDILYTAQMWLGKNSVLTLEGEMSGPQNKDLDKIYASVLSSIKMKGDTSKPITPFVIGKTPDVPGITTPKLQEPAPKPAAPAKKTP